MKQDYLLHMNKKLIITLLVFAIVLGGLFFIYKPLNEVPERNYVGNSVNECSRIQVICVDGFQRFDDKSGCGCEQI